MGKYDDIINMPHHISKVHPRMSRQERAAQFGSFSALSGHEDAVAEKARLTDEKTELSEEEILKINEKLLFIAENIKEKPEVTIVYFVPDKRKKGGSYVTFCGRIKRVDRFKKELYAEDGSIIRMADITEIYGSFFPFCD